jgi:hypothetical protein
MSDPGAMGSLGQLIVGVIVFFVFTIFKEDMLALFGGFAG